MRKNIFLMIVGLIIGIVLSLSIAHADQTCVTETYGYDDSEIYSDLEQGTCLYFQTYQENSPKNVIFIVSNSGYFIPVNSRGITHLGVSLAPGSYMSFNYSVNPYGYTPFELSGWWAYETIVLGMGPKFVQGFIRENGEIKATKMIYVTECTL